MVGHLDLLEVEAPRISRQSAHEGGEVVSLTHWPPLPPEDIGGTQSHAESTPESWCGRKV